VGLGAWFLRSPGTDKRLAREKEASFNKGLEEGRTLASPAPQVAPREIAA
jgi:hypothetical protein